MKVLILGRANCVWDDVYAVDGWISFDKVIAINGVGCDYTGHIDYWVSFHAELFPMWITKRRNNGYSDASQLWTAVNGRKRTPIEEELGCKVVECVGGSSGMIALQVALAIGGTKMVLAGVPLEARRGHYDEPGDWDEAEMHRKAWEALDSDVRAKVRSLSGWTRVFLGPPTLFWLNDGRT